jgi:hypothetical protein
VTEAEVPQHASQVIQGGGGAVAVAIRMPSGDAQ